jgi:hypothetical protein
MRTSRKVCSILARAIDEAEVLDQWGRSSRTSVAGEVDSEPRVLVHSPPTDLDAEVVDCQLRLAEGAIAVVQRHPGAVVGGWKPIMNFSAGEVGVDVVGAEDRSSDLQSAFELVRSLPSAASFDQSLNP